MVVTWSLEQREVVSEALLTLDEVDVWQAVSHVDPGPGSAAEAAGCRERQSPKRSGSGESPCCEHFTGVLCCIRSRSIGSLPAGAQACKRHDGRDSHGHGAIFRTLSIGLLFGPAAREYIRQDWTNASQAVVSFTLH